MHRGVVSASDRDAAFALLKSQGVKPYAVAEASGFFNKLLGKGKRWIAIAVLGALCVSLVFALRSSRLALRSPDAAPRHQIYGDPALMEEWEENVYLTALTDPGERILAVYAQPGGYVGWQGVASNVVFTADDVAAVEATRNSPVTFSDDDRRELRELKAIVAGMKDELREYLSDGVGSVRTYLTRLEERRHAEIAAYKKVAQELDDEQDEAVREAKNEALRAMGLRTVPRERK